MRCSIDTAARSLHVDEKIVEDAVSDGLIATDDKGVHFLLVQALARSLTQEARDLFGDDIILPAQELVFVENANTSGCKDIEFAADGRLDLSRYGLTTRGRNYIQTRDAEEWVHEHGGELTDYTTDTCLLLRDNDVTEKRAMMDAYLLGGVRIKYAVSCLVRDKQRGLIAA